MGEVIKWEMPVDIGMNVTRTQKIIRHAEWKDIIAIGYDKSGDLIIRSSKISRKDALWLIKQAELHVLEIG